MGNLQKRAGEKLPPDESERRRPALSHVQEALIARRDGEGVRCCCKVSSVRAGIGECKGG